MKMEAEIRACFIASLRTGLDETVGERGFSRSEKGLIYRRQLPEAIQKIDLVLEIHPKDEPNAAAALYPWIEVVVPRVDRLLQEMVGDDAGLLPGVTGGTLREPAEFTAGKVAPARWFIYQPETVAGIVSQLSSFLQQWALPFLDEYSSPEAICSADERGDPRVLKDRAQDLRVVAAMLLLRGPKDALARMEASFGAIGLRRRYDAVFEHLKTYT